jgi:hypothetical protein
LCPIDGIKGQKVLCVLCAFAVNAFSTAEAQRITREKNPCGECNFNRVYILGFSFVMLTPLVNVSFIFLKMFTGCFFDATSLSYLAVKSGR